MLNVQQTTHAPDWNGPFWCSELGGGSPEWPLTARLQCAFFEVDASAADQSDLLRLIEPLLTVHSPTYYHCLRVGLIAKSIALHMGEDPKPSLFAGLLHDNGKAQIPVDLLRKTGHWTRVDQARMEPHVINGYRIAKHRFAFAAEILLLHHQDERVPYPAKLPDWSHNFCARTKQLIERHATFLSIADCYDALHRQNLENGDVGSISNDEIRTRLIQRRGRHSELINDLFGAGIL